MAPATLASSTSLIEPPSAWPTAFTSDTGSGSPHATRLPGVALPLRLVGESSGINAIAATSLTTCAPMRAISMPPDSGAVGSAIISTPLPSPAP